MLFQQTSAPTGWTKQTTHDNKALRVVTGTASSGGSVAFTTAFASQAVTGSVGTTGATTLSESQMPSHVHSKMAGYACNGQIGFVSTSETVGLVNTNATGGSGSHSHSGGSFSGNAINLAVQYVDLIIASKD